MAQHAAYGENRQAGHDEVVQSGNARSRGGRWLPRLLLAGLVITAVLLLARHPGKQTPLPRPARPPTVINLGRRLLGVTASWELLARGPDDVVSIRLASGQITVTTVPALESASPDVSFLAGPHEAIVRSSDYVPGYLVPDGSGARVLTGPLAGGGPLIPGPAPGEAWVVAGPPTRPLFSLVTLTGRPLGVFIRFPPGGPQLPATAISDGRGYVLLLTGDFEYYDAGPTWDRLVSGNVAAVGPTRWLSVACDPMFRHCRNEVIDPATGALRVLPGPALRPYYYPALPPAGVISPDGSTAAVPFTGSGGKVTVRLISLISGAGRSVAVQLAATPVPQSMAWSPDGHWLFVAAAGGRLLAINARSDQVTSLRVSLPYVSQLVIEAAPG